MWIVIPYHPGDIRLAHDLVDFIYQLDKCPLDHACLLVSDAAVDWSDSFKLLQSASRVFRRVEMIANEVSIGGWPFGANSLFKTAAQFMEQRKIGPWFWMEPDCIPLKAGWADQLEGAYKKLSSPIFKFVGAVMEAKEPNMPREYLAGCAMYPALAWSIMAPVWREDKAFDIATHAAVITATAHTNLIMHFWGQKDLPPTFAETKTQESPVNTFTRDNLHPDAVVFHRNKDGTLINLLGFSRFNSPEERWADIVSLRRAGDIIALLPLLKLISEQIGRHVRLVVHKDFLKLFDGVSYVIPVPWDGGWEDPLAAAKYYKAVNAQVHGGGVALDMMRGNFAEQAWMKLGYKWNGNLPLVFDRRNFDRELELCENVFKTNKPKLLVKLHGFSSPFLDEAAVRQRIKSEFEGVCELVDLDQVRAERVYDLIGLMDRASAMVTVDTVTLWLAHASECPTIAFNNGEGFSASPSRGNCRMRVPYSMVLKKWSSISREIGKLLYLEPNRRIQQLQSARS